MAIGNVRVRESEARIASLQAQLAKMTGSPAPLAAADPVDAGTNSDSSGDKAELYPPLRQLPRLAVPYADLYRRVQVQEAVFELLTQQYETARIEEAKDVPSVSVIDAPGIAEKKSFPPRLLLALLLTFFSFAIASSLILARYYWSAMALNDPRKELAERIFPVLAESLSLHRWMAKRCRMRQHLPNAGFGVLDYVSYPIGMLLVAPIVLHRLGAAEYGLWMIATAVISAGGIIASGCCDACIQRVAYLRGTRDFDLMPHTVRSMLGINLALGSVLAIAAWIAAPYAAPHIAVSALIPSKECLIALRIASVAILLRCD